MLPIHFINWKRKNLKKKWEKTSIQTWRNPLQILKVKVNIIFGVL